MGFQILGVQAKTGHVPEAGWSVSVGGVLNPWRGGLGYFTLNYGGTKQVGDVITGVPIGTNLSGTVTFKPVESGTYTLILYRVCGTTYQSQVWSYTGSLSAGSTYSYAWSHSFPGVPNGYYLYVSGPDYVYTSPIYVKH